MNRPSLAGWRDTLIVLVGLSLVVFEAVVYRGPERWGLLMLYAGMIGSPVFMRVDEKRDSPHREAAAE